MSRGEWPLINLIYLGKNYMSIEVNAVGEKGAAYFSKPNWKENTLFDLGKLLVNKITL